MEDTGTYTAQITTATSIMYRQFMLQVYLPDPTIICDSVTCVDETSGGAVVSTGPILHLSQRPPADPPTVTCTAQNPVSNSSTTVTPKDFCAGNSLDSRALEYLDFFVQWFWFQSRLHLRSHMSPPIPWLLRGSGAMVSSCSKGV
uniref:Uncharacterized protein n=1 Tax=Pelusios castaneus TaxID=367368 RepID=A0A8C8ST00_9SAUR